MNTRIASILAVALAIAGLMFLTRPHRGASRHQPTASADSSSNSTRIVSFSRQSVSPLPAAIAPAETNSDNSAGTNLFARLLNGESPPNLTLAQVEGYLRDNHRNVESLLGAYHATMDKSLLEEAKEKFPNDPRVTFAAATQPDTSPEEHRKWLDAFKESAPDSAIPDFLSASDYIKSGRTDLALQEIQAAANKPLQDYHLDFVQNAAEAYEAAGYSEPEAKTIASMDLLLPELSAYKSVGVALVDQAKSYQQAGDSASAQASFQMAMNLGQQVNESDSLTLIQTLVGIAVQRIALSAMDPNAVYGADNQTAQSQLDALVQQRDYIRTLAKQWQAIAPYLSTQDWANYADRRWTFGEMAAMQWAIAKYTQQQ
jgi:hypothetical protein